MRRAVAQQTPGRSAMSPVGVPASPGPTWPEQVRASGIGQASGTGVLRARVLLQPAHLHLWRLPATTPPPEALVEALSHHVGATAVRASFRLLPGPLRRRGHQRPRPADGTACSSADRPSASRMAWSHVSPPDLAFLPRSLW